MKGFSVVCLIAVFIAFLFLQLKKGTEFQVLRIISPTQIVVDLNKNRIEDSNENVTLNIIESFSSKTSPEQEILAKRLKITQEDALGLGFLAGNFSRETLEFKKVKLTKNNSQIIVDNKNYGDLLLEKGFALKRGEAPTKQLLSNIEKVRKLNLVIFNNKSHKYHKLGCKYGLIAHNSQIIPAIQVPTDAKACKFCFGKHETLKKYQNDIKKDFSYVDEIPDIKSPATYFAQGNVRIYLTDMTRVLKPSNDCSTLMCKALVSEIDSAQNNIDFAIYGYTKIPKIEQALKKAQNRGVNIRFVYDLDEKNTNIYPDTNYLAGLFNNNHDISNHLMHNKFFIFDGKTVLTGSANISNTDMSGFNSNAVIIIDCPEIANVYEQEFDQMYAGKFHKRKHKIKDKDFGELSIYFSPKDKAIEQIIPLVDSAKKYIYIPAFLVTQKSLTQSLIAACKRGVAVKIILDATNTHPGSHSKINELRAVGIKVKTENWAGKLHSKSIIIDDEYTIIGSMNFSRSGDDENDENMIVIKNPQVAVFYKTFFQYLWKRIPDYWLTHNAMAESPASIGSCSDGIDNDFDGKIDKADDSCKLTFFAKKVPKKTPNKGS